MLHQLLAELKPALGTPPELAEAAVVRNLAARLRLALEPEPNRLVADSAAVVEHLRFIQQLLREDVELLRDLEQPENRTRVELARQFVEAVRHGNLVNVVRSNKIQKLRVELVRNRERGLDGQLREELELLRRELQPEQRFYIGLHVLLLLVPDQLERRRGRDQVVALLVGKWLARQLLYLQSELLKDLFHLLDICILHILL